MKDKIVPNKISLLEIWITVRPLPSIVWPGCRNPRMGIFVQRGLEERRNSERERKGALLSQKAGPQPFPFSTQRPLKMEQKTPFVLLALPAGRVFPI